MQKTKKRIKLAIIFFMLVFLFSLPAEAFEDAPANNAVVPQVKSDIQFFLNGDELITGVPSIIEEGRTLVPVRFFLEAMGAAVSWLPSTKTVSVALDDMSIEMVVGEKQPCLMTVR